MTNAPDTPADATNAPQKKLKKLPLIIGLLSAFGLGGAGFFATYTGLILDRPESLGRASPVATDFTFIPIENLSISLPAASGARVLRFSGQIEIAQSSEREMLQLHPRFVDLINTYLRAVEPADLEEPAVIFRVRAQILRRLQTIAGDGHVRDFLITEFVLS